MKHAFLALPALFALSAVACSDDPVSHSEPVNLKLKVTSGDVTAGALAADKNINTESGNPYGVFMSNATAAIGGDPSRIDVTQTTLSLSAGAVGVTKLGEIFDGATTVTIVVNGSSTRHVVASHTSVAADGVGPIDLRVDFDDGSFTDQDYGDLVGGSFKVEIAGPAAATFAAANADADLDLALTFNAYE